MARTNASPGAGVRLSDFLSISFLARVFPSDLVNRLLDAHGCNSQLIRVPECLESSLSFLMVDASTCPM
ncbi:MAG: hypothetical protein JO171_06450 [Paludibacterium sp.]|uniref:hypothetical protein n=1 Tax=Paludibacterium sp. TaxID=1917523 RepID=UPI0025DA7A19|nr:hypothetical protein [Paludibacterium sp.]MBV8046772.1 hypothetical protein [Paludibacterium sp.]